MQPRKRQSSEVTKLAVPNLAELASWENEGGVLAGDGGVAPPAASARPRKWRALGQAWHARARWLKGALGLAVVAVVCGLKGRAAYRAWQRRRPTLLQRARLQAR